MKKILSVFLSFSLILLLSGPVYAAKAETADELLIPYQKVINQVNIEIGSNYLIPDNTKEEVYDNIKRMSPDEFGKLLKNEYKTYATSLSLNDQSENDNHAEENVLSKNQSNLSIIPNYVSQNITQTHSIQYNSKMYLKSTVFSAKGTAGTYIYSSINSYGSQWSSSNKGYHFSVISGSYSLSSDKKKCTVHLNGMPKDPNGIALAVELKAAYTFSAG